MFTGQRHSNAHRDNSVGSFSKRLFFWNEADAPVQGKRYAEYLRLAQTFQSMLE